MARNRAGDATLNDPNPRELALENLALRQQLAALKHRRSRPRLTEMHRLFWTVLSKLWRDWRGALLVKAETVVRWHRQGFKRYWFWKSRRRRGRPQIHPEVRDRKPSSQTISTVLTVHLGAASL